MPAAVVWAQATPVLQGGGSGGRGGRRGPARGLTCLSSQAPALQQYRTSAGSPANQSPTSPVSNQGFSPGSSPQVRVALSLPSRCVLPTACPFHCARPPCSTHLSAPPVASPTTLCPLPALLHSLCSACCRPRPPRPLGLLLIPSPILHSARAVCTHQAAGTMTWQRRPGLRRRRVDLRRFTQSPSLGAATFLLYFCGLC